MRIRKKAENSQLWKSKRYVSCSSVNLTIYSQRLRKGGESMTILFTITTVICGIGWLKGSVSTVALIYYLEKKGYAQPNDEEIRECTLWAARHLFKR
jgi:hypothetical protein